MEKLAKTQNYSKLITDLTSLIEQGRKTAVRYVNTALVVTYWLMGRRIVEYEQKGKERAKYGEALLKKISTDLTTRFSKGFTERNLDYMRQFYLIYPEISHTPCAELPEDRATEKSHTVGAELIPILQGVSKISEMLIRKFPLSWSHYRLLIYIDEPFKREFYEAECIRGNWSVRQLDRQIQSMLYERTALSKRKLAVIAKAHEKPITLNPEDEIKDPYILEFLGLKDEYSESQLEEALIKHLEYFILELGTGFTFVARQKRITLEGTNYRLFLVVLIILILLPTFIITAALNILFPQIPKEEFSVYKDLTKETGLNWQNFLAYDTVRLNNYLKDNNPTESIFDLLRVNFTEYEITEKEEEITKTVNGKTVKETIIIKEYKLIRQLEIHRYVPIKDLLETLNYNTSEANMSINKITVFLSELNEKEEYEIETSPLTDVDITEDFDENQKEWYFALAEILPLIDPTAEFDPDEYIIPEASSNPSVPSVWPTQGRITSDFGENCQTHLHQGIDIANTIGTPIYATADGTVIAVGSSGNFGKRIMIYHGTDEEGNTYITIYAHLSQFKVDVGDIITQGTLISPDGQYRLQHWPPPPLRNPP